MDKHGASGPVDTRAPVAGGVKKVLYTLQTAQRIGLKNTAKALRARNTCKACGLGMGGQLGGMVNELGEFPSVCNKSLQAQSTDIQPPIPAVIFDHPLHELRELDGHELEHLGRLGSPIYKAAGGDRYQPVDWGFALNRAARVLRATDPDRSFFYSSGRSSNEAGFLLQLFARLYGTNNVNNCSYYCHQATSVALGNTVGTGTSTVELADLTGCDLLILAGANPASNHPRLIHQLQAIRERGGDVIVINPARESGLVRFAVPKSPKSMLSGGTWIASDYLQPRIGSDVTLFKALAKAVVEAGGQDDAFIAEHANGYAEFRADLETLDWEMLCTQCGLERADIDRVADRYCRAERVIFAWGMGLTHHVNGVDNIEALASLALLRGMVGKRFAGLLPLRGHSNIQGIGTVGVKPALPEAVLASLESELGVTLPRKPGFDTMAATQAAAAGEIDAAVIMGGNLYGANPDAAWVEKALDRIGFKLFLTTTLNRSHLFGVDTGESLVLPVAARDEEWQPTTQESMFNYVRMSDGGITRLRDARPEVLVLADLAERVLDDCPVDLRQFRNHRRIRQAIARTVPGMQDLADIDTTRREFHVRGRLLHAPKFPTADGRAAFRVVPMPAVSRARPFTLTTIRSEGQFNTIIYERQDTYRGTQNRWAVLMNPDDMSALGVGEGAEVDLVSDQGRMAGVMVHAFDLPAGAIGAYFPEANVLIGNAVDRRSQTPGFKATPVTVEVAGTN
ncbi:MAG: FdhF/YdeP family oxidoreductase [Chromatiales bacterium]|nr:MAG: FdhF/YdeP family oxidoreductase [Chromatiales bacterium]